MRENWKKSLKALLGGLLLCMMAVIVLPAMTSEAAAKKPTCTSSQTIYCYKEGSSYIACENNGIFIKNLSSNAVITNIKCSNSKAYARSWKQWDGNEYGSFNAVYVGGSFTKSTAKSKVTFSVKQNGKTYKLSCNVTFKLKPNPFKTLKLGTKNYASKFNKGKYEATITSPDKKVKLTVKTSSSYKIDSIYVYYKSGSQKKVKSGSTINTKNVSDIMIMYKQVKKPANYQSPNWWYYEASKPLTYTAFLNLK